MKFIYLNCDARRQKCDGRCTRLWRLEIHLLAVMAIRFFVHLGMCTWYCIVEACTVYKQLLRDSRNWQYHTRFPNSCINQVRKASIYLYSISSFQFQLPDQTNPINDFYCGLMKCASYAPDFCVLERRLRYFLRRRHPRYPGLVLIGGSLQPLEDQPRTKTSHRPHLSQALHLYRLVCIRNRQKKHKAPSPGPTHPETTATHNI